MNAYVKQLWLATVKVWPLLIVMIYYREDNELIIVENGHDGKIIVIINADWMAA